jgi:hypothetical protein
MALVTKSELSELVPELRAMAVVATRSELRYALTRLANRYATMATGTRNPRSATGASEVEPLHRPAAEPSPGIGDAALTTHQSN